MRICNSCHKITVETYDTCPFCHSADTREYTDADRKAHGQKPADGRSGSVSKPRLIAAIVLLVAALASIALGTYTLITHQATVQKEGVTASYNAATGELHYSGTMSWSSESGISFGSGDLFALAKKAYGWRLYGGFGFGALLLLVGGLELRKALRG